MKLRNILIIFSLFLTSILITYPEFANSWGRRQIDELNTCTNACNSGDCSLCNSNECSQFASHLGKAFTSCQQLPNCQKACSNNSDCTTCLGSDCTTALGSNATTAQSSCQAAAQSAKLLASCNSACSNNSDCTTCLGSDCTKALGSNATTAQSSCQKAAKQAAAATSCQSACTNNSNCSTCLSSSCTTALGSNASTVQKTCSTCNTTCTNSSDCPNCLNASNNCGAISIPAISSGYSTCKSNQAAAQTAANNLSECQSAINAAGNNATQCSNALGSAPCVALGITSDNFASKISTYSWLGTCYNVLDCQNSVSSLGANPTTAQCTSALGNSGCTALNITSSNTASEVGTYSWLSACNTAFTTAQKAASALSTCQSAVSAAGSDYTQCNNALATASCSSAGITPANLSTQAANNSWLGVCNTAISNYNTCQTACNNKNCSTTNGCLSSTCAGISAITSLPTYAQCSAGQTCQNNCSINSPTYDACNSQCWGSNSCKSSNVTPTTSTALDPWLANCAATYTQYQKCEDACNSSSLDCSTCTSGSCSSISEITALSGFQSCSSCGSACANAPQSMSSSIPDNQWANCATCVASCTKSGVNASASNAPAALGVCNSNNYWTACDAGCAAAAALPSTTAPSQISSACTNCMSSNACQAALQSNNVSTFGGVQISSQYKNLNACQKSVSTAAEWTQCDSACAGQTTTSGCNSCLTGSTACSSLSITPASLSTYSLQPAYTNLKACQEALDSLNNCASACNGAPTPPNLPASNSATWNTCGACTKACTTQGISAGAQGAPLALGVCNTSTYLSACDAGCAGAANDKSPSGCTACLNQVPACLLGGIESAATLTNTSSPFTVPAANTNLAACQTWLLKDQNFSQCDAACANAVTQAQCSSCINNANCQAANVGIASVADLVAMTSLSSTTYNNLKGCQTILSNNSSCTGACANAPQNATTAGSSTTWNSCPSCVSGCAAVGVTPSSSNQSIPAGLQACSGTNALAACDAACASANTSGQLANCNSCITNNPACMVAIANAATAAGTTASALSGTTAITDFQAMSLTSTTPNLQGCQKLMLSDQYLTGCDTACQGLTTASSCSNAIATNTSCKNAGSPTTLTAGITSSSYPKLAACINLIQGVSACTKGCASAPTDPKTPASSSAWSSCAGCISACQGVTTTTDGAPAALGVCLASNYQTACDSGCAGAVPSGSSTSNPSSAVVSSCNTCVGNAACAAAGWTPQNILGINLPTNLTNVLACQNVLEGAQTATSWSACDSNCQNATTAAACTTALATPACNSAGVTVESIVNMSVLPSYPNVANCQSLLNTNNCQEACASVPQSATIAPQSAGWSNWNNCSTCTSTCSKNNITAFSLNPPAGLSVCTQNNYVAACNNNCATAAAAAKASSIDPTAANQCNTCLSDPVCALAGITPNGVQSGSADAILSQAGSDNTSNLSTCQSAMTNFASCQSSCNAATTNYNQCQTGCWSNDVCNSVGVTGETIIDLATGKTSFTSAPMNWLVPCATAYNAGNICSQSCALAAAVTPAAAMAQACQLTEPSSPTSVSASCFAHPACQHIDLTIANASTFTDINGASQCATTVGSQTSTCTGYCNNSTNCTGCLSQACVGLTTNSTACSTAYAQCATLLKEAPSYSSASTNNDSTIAAMLNLCSVSGSTATLNSTFTGCTSACNTFGSNQTYNNAVACVNACKALEGVAPTFLTATANLTSQSSLAAANQSIAPYYQAAVQIVKACQAANTTSLSASNAAAAINTCTSCYNGISSIAGITLSESNTSNYMPSGCNGLIMETDSCTTACNNAMGGTPTTAVPNTLGITSSQMCSACPSSINSEFSANDCYQALSVINPNASQVSINDLAAICTNGSLVSTYQNCVNACQYPDNADPGYSWAANCINGCSSLASENSALFNVSANLNSGQSIAAYYQAAQTIKYCYTACTTSDCNTCLGSTCSPFPSIVSGYGGECQDQVNNCANWCTPGNGSFDNCLAPDCSTLDIVRGTANFQNAQEQWNTCSSTCIPPSNSGVSLTSGWAQNCVNACSALVTQSAQLSGGTPNLNPGSSTGDFYQAALTINNTVNSATLGYQNMGDNPDLISSCVNAYNTLLRIPGIGLPQYPNVNTTQVINSYSPSNDSVADQYNYITSNFISGYCSNVFATTNNCQTACGYILNGFATYSPVQNNATTYAKLAQYCTSYSDCSDRWNCYSTIANKECGDVLSYCEKYSDGPTLISIAETACPGITF